MHLVIITIIISTDIMDTSKNLVVHICTLVVFNSFPGTLSYMFYIEPILVKNCCWHMKKQNFTSFGDLISQLTSYVISHR